MELNGEVTPPSPNGSENTSDFIVLDHGSGEFRRDSEAESMEEVGLRIRQLLLENKELRENAQKNTSAMSQQYEVLKQWKDQELGRQEKIRTQYSQAREIIVSVREENVRLKQQVEHLERAARSSQGETTENEDANLELEMLHEQLTQLKQQNEVLLKKSLTANQLSQLSDAAPKKMTTSSMEVNVASHSTMETQTETPAESSTKEFEAARMQANQLMQDLESLQKLKNDIEQQKVKVEQERDDLMNRVIERENIAVKILREKREVVALNNQLNLEIDRLMKENANLWESEKEKTESLKNYDTIQDIQDFSKELDQRLDLAPLPSLSLDKEVAMETEEKAQTADVGVASGSIAIKSGELRDRSVAIQQILLQLQEQQEENQKITKEASAKVQQISQLETELEEQKKAVKKKEMEIEEMRSKCEKEKDDLMLRNVEKENSAQRVFKEEKQELESKIGALHVDVSQKIVAMNELKKHMENTTELYQKQASSLNDIVQKREAEIADQTQVLAMMNNSHRQQIEEMRREILQLSEASAHKQQKSMSEHQQVELLQQQVNTLIIDLRAESTKLEAKTKMCNDYKCENDRLNHELQKLQTKNNEVLEGLKLQIGSQQSRLHAAEVDNEKKRHDIEEMSQSQKQLLSDYEELYQKHGGLLKLKAAVEQKLQARVTQLQGESIRGQEEVKALRDDVRIKQDEIQDLFQRIRLLEEAKEDSSVYQIQAEVYKEDFTREREARERAHSELAESQAHLDSLLLEKQRLDEELQRYSQQQIAQMQRRDDYVVVPQSQQHPMRQYPHPQNESNLDGFGIPQQHLTPQHQARRASPGRQAPERHTCPKCGVGFDDLDTLQIHVFDCLDQP